VIYNLKHNFVFIHIPRTAGMSISRAIFNALPNSYINLVEWRHRYGMEIQHMEELHAQFPTMYKFTVIRNPWEIVESDYSLTIQEIQEPSFVRRMTCQDGWARRLERTRHYSGFTEFVAREYLGGLNPVLEGGFYETWCCKMNGTDLGIDYIRFKNLEERWPHICQQIGIPICDLPRDNVVERQKCIWTAQARDAIADLCQKDLEKFHFKFQGTLAS